jgi:hypothetical protein
MTLDLSPEHQEVRAAGTSTSTWRAHPATRWTFVVSALDTSINDLVAIPRWAL